MAHMQKLRNVRVDPRFRDRVLADIAFQLASDHPAEAEQVFNLREGGNHELDSLPYIQGLCRRLAQVDPTRSPSRCRVLGRSLETHLRLGGRGPWPGRKGQGRSLRGGGSRDPGDRSAAGIGTESRAGRTSRFPLSDRTNPAALILPIVERAAPERLAEVFWRAVALLTRINPERESQFQHSNLG